MDDPRKAVDESETTSTSYYTNSRPLANAAGEQAAMPEETAASAEQRISLEQVTAAMAQIDAVTHKSAIRANLAAGTPNRWRSRPRSFTGGPSRVKPRPR